MTRRIFHHGLVAELMETPAGRAWGISSAENGFEEFARQEQDGTWGMYVDVQSLATNRPVASGFPRLETCMEAIAMKNRATAENASKRKGKTMTTEELAKLRKLLINAGEIAEICADESDDDSGYLDIISGVHEAVAIVDRQPFNLVELRQAS